MNTATLSAADNTRLQMAAERLSVTIQAARQLSSQVMQTIREMLARMIAAIAKLMRSIFKRNAHDAEEPHAGDAKRALAGAADRQSRDSTSHGPGASLKQGLAATDATAASSPSAIAEPLHTDSNPDALDQAIETLEDVIKIAVEQLRALAVNAKPEEVLQILRTVAQQKLQDHVMDLARNMDELRAEVDKLGELTNAPASSALEALIGATTNQIQYLDGKHPGFEAIANNINRLRIEVTDKRARVLSAQGLISSCATELKNSDRVAQGEVVDDWILQFETPARAEDAAKDPLQVLLESISQRDGGVDRPAADRA